MVIKFKYLFNRQISQNSQKFEHLTLHQRLFISPTKFRDLLGRQKFFHAGVVFRGSYLALLAAL